MTKKAVKRPPPRRRRVPKPFLAMATPPSESVMASIESLSNGQIKPSLRVPGRSVPRTIDRALAEFLRFGMGCIDVEFKLAEYRAQKTADKPVITEAMLQDMIDRKAAVLKKAKPAAPVVPVVPEVVAP